MKKLEDELGCEVVEISALKGEGSVKLAEKAMELAKNRQVNERPHVFTGSVEHAIAHIEESVSSSVDKQSLRWYAIKIFERDNRVMEASALMQKLKQHLDEHIRDCEDEMEDDAESIITNQRYAYINRVVSAAVVKKKKQKCVDCIRHDRQGCYEQNTGTADFCTGYVPCLLHICDQHRHGRDRLDE